MRKLLLWMLCLLTGASVWAAREKRILVVELKGGETLNYDLIQKPTLSLNGDELLISFHDIIYPDPENPTPESGRIDTDRSLFTCQVDHVKNFHFKLYEADLMESPLAQQPMIWIKQIDRQTVTISGTEESDHIRLYAANGSLVRSAISPEKGETVISIGSLEKGIYIIQVNEKVSFKILKQ